MASHGIPHIVWVIGHRQDFIQNPVGFGNGVFLWGGDLCNFIWGHPLRSGELPRFHGHIEKADKLDPAQMTLPGYD